ncbi:hypothetical protein BB561_005446 [Smittium simulii]|uniref:Topoisomerase I damage affected protein 2 n=1 Tax=Smittium simulii TaxID=133385 RepID=A0A2T9YAC8_9FUNG|nr:hypothetical protein BB561_005446 [Smittium simulii]
MEEQGVDLAMADGTYKHSKLEELEKNILEYINKKLGSFQQNSASKTKFVVTATFVQKNSSGFASGTSVFWDADQDGLAKYSYHSDSMLVSVTAYWFASTAN